MLRRQLPVWSPLSLPAIARGVGALMWPRSAVDRLQGVISSDFPAQLPIMTDSGTSALRLALGLSARSGSTPRVALPAWGCYDLATAALGAGADVWFYDLDPASLQPAPGALESLASESLTAVVAVHFFGLPTALAPLRALADRTGALLIEDAAQAIGLEIDGRPAGSFGDLGVLSFGRGKGWTGGSGGALLLGTRFQAERTQLAQRLSARTGSGVELVKLGAQWLLGRPAVYGLPSRIPSLRLGETVLHPPQEPRAMSAVAAATLLGTRAAARSEVERRRRHAATWRSALQGVAGVTVLDVARSDWGGWLRFPLLAADRRVECLSGPAARSLGIIRAYPLPLGAVWGRGRWQAAPGAEALATRLFTLPTHGFLKPSDVGRVIGLLAA